MEHRHRAGAARPETLRREANLVNVFFCWDHGAATSGRATPASPVLSNWQVAEKINQRHTGRTQSGERGALTQTRLTLQVFCLRT